ncbi:MAG: hypothetical protein R3C15_22275 [Thermoleophilia bacterium]
MVEYTLHLETEASVGDAGLDRVAEIVYSSPGRLLGPSISLSEISGEVGRLGVTCQVEAPTLNEALEVGLVAFRAAIREADVDAAVERVMVNLGGPDDWLR